MPKRTQETENYAWTQRIPLLTNRHVLFEIMIGLLIPTIMTTGVASIGGLGPADLALFGGTIFGGLLLVYVVAAFVAGNSVEASFKVGGEGVRFTAGEKRRKWSRKSLAVGILTGSLSGFGATSLASGGNEVLYRWKDAKEVSVDERGRVISLTSGWLTLVRVYCTEENFAQVRGLIERRVAVQNRGKKK